MEFIWKWKEGYYSTAYQGAVESPEGEVTPLYKDKNNPNNLQLADKDFLRETILFYGFPLPEHMQTTLEKQTAIQEKYTVELQALLQSINVERILNPESDTSALVEKYTTLRDEMRDKINEVEHNG